MAFLLCWWAVNLHNQEMQYLLYLGHEQYSQVNDLSCGFFVYNKHLHQALPQQVW